MRCGGATASSTTHGHGHACMHRSGGQRAGRHVRPKCTLHLPRARERLASRAECESRHMGSCSVRPMQNCCVLALTRVACGTTLDVPVHGVSKHTQRRSTATCVLESSPPRDKPRRGGLRAEGGGGRRGRERGAPPLVLGPSRGTSDAPRLRYAARPACTTSGWGCRCRRPLPRLPPPSSPLHSRVGGRRGRRGRRGATQAGRRRRLLGEKGTDCRGKARC